MNPTEKAREVYIKNGLAHIWNQYGASIEQTMEEIEKGTKDLRSLLLKALLTGVGTVAVLRDKEQRDKFLTDFYNEVVMPVVEKFDNPETHAEIARLMAKAKARSEEGGETKH